ncbi:MAG: hypothetical protein WCD08_00805, partial [Steroidobacteraceae bacterium]
MKKSPAVTRAAMLIALLALGACSREANLPANNPSGDATASAPAPAAPAPAATAPAAGASTPTAAPAAAGPDASV